MPTPPPSVRTIDTLQGVRFLLPSHPLLRLAGLVPILFGLLFSGFAVFWILGAAGIITPGSPSPSPSQQPSTFTILFPLFGLPFLVIGLVPVAIGLRLLLGRPEFEIRGDRFRTGIRLGPLQRAKWRPLDAIERLEINRFGMRNASSGSHVLRFHIGEDRPLNVTGSRDRAWLEQLAQAIVARIDRGQLADTPPEIITRDRDPDLDAKDGNDAPEVISEDVPDPGDPPPGCKLWVEHSPTGPTIFIPPRGLRAKPIPALLFFVVFWLPVTNIIGGAFLFGARGSLPFPAAVLVPLVVILFEAVGIGILVLALSLARRRAILDVTDDARTLLVTQSGLRKSSQREIPAADITAIQVQNSATTVNDQPLRQVSIKVAGAKDLDLLTGAPESHLRWLAEKLRHALASPQ